MAHIIFSDECLSSFIPRSWEEFFNSFEIEKELDKLDTLLLNEVFYPDRSLIFRAFELSPKPKVIIIGQDPYYQKGVADGLAFSATTLTGSLRNIFKVLNEDGFKSQGSSLEKWAKEGVLLLNQALTVQRGKASSHLRLWKNFTRYLIRYLGTKEYLIWILWGKKSQEYRKFINPSHSIIEGSHPSPNVTDGSFLKGKYFSECNNLLQEKGLSPINWNLD